MHILLVEHPTRLGPALQAIQGQCDHTVLGCADGPEALSIGARRRPDLAVISLTMDRLDSGFGLAGTLFARWGTRSILLGSPPDSRNGVDRSALAYLPVPYKSEVLIASITVSAALLGQTERPHFA